MESKRDRVDRWLESVINIAANTVTNYSMRGKANAVMVWNPSATDFLYMSTSDRVGVNFFDARIQTQSWGVISRPFAFKDVFLFSPAIVAGIRVTEIFTEQPLMLIQSMLGDPSATGDVRVTATAGLTAAQLNRDGAGNLGVSPNPYPIGAAPFCVRATSGDNAAASATVAAVANQRHYLLGYTVVARGAAVGAAGAAVVVKDGAGVVLYDSLPAAAPIGSRVASGLGGPIVRGTVNTAMVLEVAAAGAGCITELTIFGFTM